MVGLQRPAAGTASEEAAAGRRISATAIASAADFGYVRDQGGARADGEAIALGRLWRGGNGWSAPHRWSDYMAALMAEAEQRAQAPQGASFAADPCAARRCAADGACARLLQLPWRRPPGEQDVRSAD